MPYILVLYYSQYGAVQKLANFIARGVESVDGIEAKVRTVPNVSPNNEVTTPSVPKDGSPYVTLEDLENASGLALGSATRFGNMSASMKHFLDTTTGLWFNGALINKPACVFTSSSSMHGGQESTLLSMMIPLIHHGAVIVGLPYSNPELGSTITGGTPYGVTHVAGQDNKNPISEDEQKLAIAQGKRLAELALKLNK